MVQLKHKKRGGVLKVEPCSKAALLDKSCKEGPTPAISSEEIMQKDRRTPAGAGRKSVLRSAGTNNPWNMPSVKGCALLKPGSSFPIVPGSLWVQQCAAQHWSVAQSCVHAGG